MTLPQIVETKLLEVSVAFTSGIVKKEQTYELLNLLCQLAFAEGQSEGIRTLARFLKESAQS